MKLENMLLNQYVIGVHIRLGGPTVGDLDYRHSTSVISYGQGWKRPVLLAQICVQLHYG